MAFNGSGVFQRLYNWITDRGNGIKIRADRMDAEMDGFATGLSTCITKDGQTTVTANIPMSTFRHTGLGAGSTSGHSVRWEQVLGNTVSPTQIAATQNNYAPTGIATAAILRLDLDAARSMTGLSATVGKGEITLVNISAFVLTLENADAGSDAANRFAFGADYPLLPGRSVSLVYDTVTANWRLPSELPSVGVVTLASGSFPAAAVLDIASIPASYRELQLRMTGVSCDTATRKCRVQISIDNGSSFIATNYGSIVIDSLGAAATGTTWLAQNSTDLAAAATVAMVVSITNYQGGLYVQGQFSGVDSAGVTFGGNGAYQAGTTAVNALRVLWNGAGNFDAGTYILYGIR